MSRRTQTAVREPGRRYGHFKGAFRHRGFTLIELMIVVGIIGLLAALAVPTYRDMILRARVAEGLQFLSPYKQEVAEQILTIGRIPNAAGDPANVDYYDTGGSGVVQRVRWSRQRAALEIWFGADAGDELDGAILWLIPSLQATGITWLCRGHPEASYFMEPRYLPASCR